MKRAAPVTEPPFSFGAFMVKLSVRTETSP
jgi:hypothetical protein